MATRPPCRASSRRAEIVGVALDLAFEVGPAHVSTGMIARQMGISQPAVYKHFRRKQDIWTAVGEDIAARIAAITQGAQTADAPVAQRIRTQILDHLRLIQSLALRMVLSRSPDGLVDEGERLLELQLQGFSCHTGNHISDRDN